MSRRRRSPSVPWTVVTSGGGFRCVYDGPEPLSEGQPTRGTPGYPLPRDGDRQEHRPDSTQGVRPPAARVLVPAVPAPRLPSRPRSSWTGRDGPQRRRKCTAEAPDVGVDTGTGPTRPVTDRGLRADAARGPGATFGSPPSNFDPTVPPVGPGPDRCRPPEGLLDREPPHPLSRPTGALSYYWNSESLSRRPEVEDYPESRHGVGQAGPGLTVRPSLTPARPEHPSHNPFKDQPPPPRIGVQSQSKLSQTPCLQGRRHPGSGL